MASAIFMQLSGDCLVEVYDGHADVDAQNKGACKADNCADDRAKNTKAANEYAYKGAYKAYEKSPAKEGDSAPGEDQ